METIIKTKTETKKEKDNTIKTGVITIIGSILTLIYNLIQNAIL